MTGLVSQVKAPVPHFLANVVDRPGVDTVTSKLFIGEPVDAGKSFCEPTFAEAGVDFGSLSHEFLTTPPTAVEDPSQIDVIAGLSAAEDRSNFRRDRVPLGKHRAYGQPHRLKLAKIGGQIDSCDLARAGIGYLKPGKESAPRISNTSKPDLR